MPGRLRWMLIALPPLATAQLVTATWPEPTADAVEIATGAPEPPRQPARAPLQAPRAPRSAPHDAASSVTLAAVAPSVAAPRSDDVRLEEEADPSRDSAAPLALAAAPEADQDTTPSEAGREIFFGPRDAPRVALTFDDGPSEGNTERILDILDAKGVQATFFVLGPRVEKRPDLVVRADAEGHEIANHGWSHSSLRSLWASQVEAEIDRTGALVHDAIGHRPLLFRPAFGRYPRSSIALVRERGMDLVLWSVDGEDWGADVDPDATAERVLAQARAGSIILLHDREPSTALALPRIIDGLRERGLEPGPVSWVTGLRAYADARPTGTATTRPSAATDTDCVGHSRG